MRPEQSPVSRSPRGTRANQQDNVRAGTLRVVLAGFCLFALPVLLPTTRQYVGVLVAYLLSTIVFQLAIAKDIGGAYRVLLGGIADAAFLTFIVHRMGSASTPLMTAYLAIGTFNALAVPGWAAVTLALVGISSYAGIRYAEALGYLPYAPDFPNLAAFRPDLFSALSSVLLLGTFVAVSTGISLRMARALHAREEELRKANVKLEELSQQDPLTLLYNRRYFVRRAGEELERVRRGHPMALLMLDLDGFKQVNDTFGHLTGDEVLRVVAMAIQGSVRTVDVVGRFGGDEFVVMLTDTMAEEAIIVARRLNSRIHDAAAQVAPTRPVTASIGIALARADHDVTILFNLADDAAYRAKQAGGNRFSLAPRKEESEEAVDSGLRASNGE